jgi:hypothetical protein
MMARTASDYAQPTVPFRLTVVLDIDPELARLLDGQEVRARDVRVRLRGRYDLPDRESNERVRFGPTALGSPAYEFTIVGWLQATTDRLDRRQPVITASTPRESSRNDDQLRSRRDLA